MEVPDACPQCHTLHAVQASGTVEAPFRPEKGLKDMVLGLALVIPSVAGFANLPAKSLGHSFQVLMLAMVGMGIWAVHSGFGKMLGYHARLAAWEFQRNLLSVNRTCQECGHVWTPGS